MNGKPRDQIDLDLEEGRPVISSVADPLALRVAQLFSEAERSEFYDELGSRALRSPAHAEWLRDPHRYLSALDPETATAIHTHLEDLHRRMLSRAKARGWEVDG